MQMTQIYLTLRPADPNSLAVVVDCLCDVNCLMAQNLIQLNSSKPEIILFSPPNSIGIIGPLAHWSAARNFGVLIDSELN